MASNWNYKTNLKSNHFVAEDETSKMANETKVIQTTEKTALQMIKDWFSSTDFKFISKKIAKSLALMLPLVATLFLVREAQKRQSLDSMAGAGTAKIFFQTSQATLPPETSFKLLANTDGPVGFVRIELTFDKNLVKLTKEFDPSLSPFKRIVSISSMSEANVTGRMVIVMGLEPSSLSNPPSGDISLGTLWFVPNTTIPNVNTDVSVDSAKTQFVNLNQNIFNIQPISLQFSINPSATPTAMSTATPIPPIVTPSSTTISSTPITDPAKDCSSCHKRRCDNVCDSKRDGISCPDCN